MAHTTPMDQPIDACRAITQARREETKRRVARVGRDHADHSIRSQSEIGMKRPSEGKTRRTLEETYVSREPEHQ
eukprot:6177819-Pleurochrysis_carterae.AAC.6